MNGSATPLCSVCLSSLGTHGGPSTLPCGHNGCMQCLSAVQQLNATCPLCRTPFPRDMQLMPNRELQELVALAKALHSVSANDNGWQTVTVDRPRLQAAQDYGEDWEDGGVPTLPLVPRNMADVTLEAVRQGHACVLQLEPPVWQADSSAPTCSRCRAIFGPLSSWRHHCRLCGKVFCNRCCHRRMLMPRSFQMAQPQRACADCALLLEPRQDFLAGTISRAVQPPVHDVTDFSALRSYLNVPIFGSLETYIFQATNILRAMTAPTAIIAPEKSIPPPLLCNAAGFAVLTVAKAAMGWSVACGGGVVVARRPGGGWSRPCGISLYSCGWGLQAGGALCDLILVLRNEAALRAFCGALHCGVGVGANLTAGPIGRHAEAGMHVGSNGAAALCYAYSRGRGAFAGVSVEGSRITVRNDLNLDFYGRSVTARSLLFGDSPGGAPGADVLHSALDDLLSRLADNASMSPSKGMLALPMGNAPRALPAPAGETGSSRVPSEGLAGLPPLPDLEGPSASASPGSSPAGPDRAGWQGYPRVSGPAPRSPGAPPRVAPPADLAEDGAEVDDVDDADGFDGFMPGLFD